jgi:hypothetical protein
MRNDPIKMYARGQKTGSAFLCLPVFPALLRRSRINGSAFSRLPDWQGQRGCAGQCYVRYKSSDSGSFVLRSGHDVENKPPGPEPAKPRSGPWCRVLQNHA